MPQLGILKWKLHKWKSSSAEFHTVSCHLSFAHTWKPLPHYFSFYLQFKSYGLPAVISKSGFSLLCVYPFVREGGHYPLNINYAGNKTRFLCYMKDGLCPIKPNRCHFQINSSLLLQQSADSVVHLFWPCSLPFPLIECWIIHIFCRKCSHLTENTWSFKWLHTHSTLALQILCKVQ